MKDISSALLSAQKFEQTIGGKTGKRIPYIELVFHSLTDATLDYSDRRKGIEYRESIYSGSGVIQLANDDHLVEWIIGYWVEILFGDYFFDDDGNITGPEGNHRARLWVESQMDISFPGTKDVVLELTDCWKMLEMPCLIEGINSVMVDGVDEKAPYHYAKFGDNFSEATRAVIIDYCLESVGFGHELIEQSDGFIDSYFAYNFFINEHYRTLRITESSSYKGKYESHKDVIQRALSETQMYLRITGGFGDPLFSYIYPQEDDEVNETYYSYKEPSFDEFVYRKISVKPNYIDTYCNYDYEATDPAGYVVGDFTDLIIGHAQDDISISEIGIFRYMEWAPDIHDQETADFVAHSILSRQIVASKGGRLLIPHDARVELFDKVEVFDTR